MNSPVGREADEGAAVPELDTSRPHPARIYDYYLGGCRSSEYLELPGTGHLTLVTDPELVIGPVLDFFRRTDTRN